MCYNFGSLIALVCYMDKSHSNFKDMVVAMFRVRGDFAF